MAEFVPTPGGIIVPICARCGCAMPLAKFEPDKPGYDRRTFECPRCHEVKTEIVEHQ